MDGKSSAAWHEVSAWFDRLLDLPPAEREAALQAADVDDGVRAQVRRLLKALDDRPAFLETPAAAEAAPAVEYSSLAAGERIGAFRIDRLIGRGGMGEVYLAQRVDADFRQQVALKLLRPESVGRLAHFENERRILAALEHPGIARLVDGGVAPDGRPWMAMEFVDGVDIVTWANERGLDLPARLQLFRRVCEAVDAAHRRLVVHRDLKPANILVTADGEPKLLDFGIARLADDGVAPGQTLLLFTPDYAAPEQLEGGGITMATDVYALGLLLHELLSGTSPWRSGGVLPSRLTRRPGDEPPPPSQAPSPPVPAKLLRGDLDAIVAKALRADPASRYQSASQLWADVARHLDRQPVLARGDARGYRVRRFVSRHRVGVAAAAAVFVALAAGLVGTAWQARQAAIERDQVRVEMARADAVKNYLLLMFRTAGEGGGGDDTTAKEVLDQSARRLEEEYRDDPAARAELIEVIGSLYLYMNDTDGARPLLRGFLESPEAAAAPPATRAEIASMLADVEVLAGDIPAARRWIDEAHAFWNTDPARYRKPLMGSRLTQARIEKEESGLEASIRTIEATLQEHDAYYGRDNIETASVLNSLGIAYQNNGEIDKADAAFTASWAAYEAMDATRSAAALLTLGNWATVAFRKNDPEAAEQRLRQASDLRRELYGPSAALAAMQGNLGKIMLRNGKTADAVPLLLDALAMSRQHTGAQSPLTVAILQSLTEARQREGDLDAAAAFLAEAREAARAAAGEDGLLYAICDGLDARLHAARGDRAGADRLADSMATKITALGATAAPYQAEVTRLRAELAAR